MTRSFNKINIKKYYKLLKKLHEDIYGQKKTNFLKKFIKKFKKNKVQNSKTKTNIINILPEQFTDDECIICLEKFNKKDNIILLCNHQYHRTCLKRWAKEQDNCPLCRKTLNKKEYNSLYTNSELAYLNIMKFSKTSLEFIIVGPLILLCDLIILAGNLIKFGIEIPLVILNYICCWNVNIPECHRQCWEDADYPFSNIRSYLILFICKRIKGYFGIRLKMTELLTKYDEYYGE
jgi:hypothetical protein